MLSVDATLTPADLTTADDHALMEYLTGVNTDAKRMTTTHLRYPIRHAQLNAVLAELERRAYVRLLAG